MKHFKRMKSIAVITVFALVVGQLMVLSNSVVQAATLTTGSVAISDSRPSEASVTYTVDFSNVTTSAIQCIQVKFDTQADGAGGVPAGMVTTGASVDDASTDYIPTPASWAEDVASNGTVKFTYATGETPASTSARTFVIDGITNGNTADTGYYAILSTYNNTDCATSPVDSGTAMYIFTNGQTVSLTVDPTLSFSLATVASGQTVNGATTNVETGTDTIPFGTVTSTTDVIGAHDLSVTTNAAGGYTVYTRYTGQLTSGSNTIDNTSGTNAAPAAFDADESFGYTTDDATLQAAAVDRFTTAGGDKWAAYTATNAEVAYSAAAVDAETTRVGYEVGIAGTTEAGTYTSTVIYTATPTY